jgi:hypothetical protein
MLPCPRTMTRRTRPLPPPIRTPAHRPVGPADVGLWRGEPRVGGGLRRLRRRAAEARRHRRRRGRALARRRRARRRRRGRGTIAAAHPQEGQQRLGGVWGAGGLAGARGVARAACPGAHHQVGCAQHAARVVVAERAGDGGRIARAKPRIQVAGRCQSPEGSVAASARQPIWWEPPAVTGAPNGALSGPQCESMQF